MRRRWTSVARLPRRRPALGPPASAASPRARRRSRSTVRQNAPPSGRTRCTARRWHRRPARSIPDAVVAAGRRLRRLRTSPGNREVGQDRQVKRRSPAQPARSVRALTTSPSTVAPKPTTNTRRTSAVRRPSEEAVPGPQLRAPHAALPRRVGVGDLTATSQATWSGSRVAPPPAHSRSHSSTASAVQLTSPVTPSTWSTTLVTHPADDLRPLLFSLPLVHLSLHPRSQVGIQLADRELQPPQRLRADPDPATAGDVVVVRLAALDRRLAQLV